MVELASSISMVAPYYNLAFTVIVVYLFIQLFRTHQEGRRVYMAPWGFIFAALMMFVLETVITILRAAGVLQLPRNINGFFELVIISTFIYALLLQKQWLTNEFGPEMSVEASSAPEVIAPVVPSPIFLGSEPSVPEPDSLSIPSVRKPKVKKVKKSPPIGPSSSF